ncbi:secretory lipase-domain-containing protein, partial [Lasiosphaeria miniovina]
PPSRDEWYKAPAGWESAAPGTPLRVRSHAYNPAVLNIKNCRDVFQVLYRSSDTHGNASWAVTTVFVPQKYANCTAAPASANCTASTPATQQRDDFHALVSYQVPMDSVSVDASPSWLLQSREPYGELRDLLARGWLVAAPDYEGPQASYCAGGQAAYATLDGIRAVLAVTITSGSTANITTTTTSNHSTAAAPAIPYRLHGGGGYGANSTLPRVAIWGYSGGAFAAAFALERAAAYAADLVPFLAGVVVGGPAPNLTTVAQNMNARDTAGLLVASLVGVTAQQAPARAALEARLNAAGPRNATAFLAVRRMSGVDALVAYAMQNVYDYFQGGERDVWSPLVQQVIDADAVMGARPQQLSMPRSVPVFVYKAVQDEMSGVGETDELVSRYCEAGATVLYHRNVLGGHNDELWSGRLRTLAFLENVLDG